MLPDVEASPLRLGPELPGASPRGKTMGFCGGNDKNMCNMSHKMTPSGSHYESAAEMGILSQTIVINNQVWTHPQMGFQWFSWDKGINYPGKRPQTVWVE